MQFNCNSKFSYCRIRKGCNKQQLHSSSDEIETFCCEKRFSRNYTAIKEVLSESFELLIALCQSKDDAVSKLLSCNHLAVRRRRWFEKLKMLENIFEFCGMVHWSIERIQVVCCASSYPLLDIKQSNLRKSSLLGGCFSISRSKESSFI